MEGLKYITKSNGTESERLIIASCLHNNKQCDLVKGYVSGHHFRNVITSNLWKSIQTFTDNENSFDVLTLWQKALTLDLGVEKEEVIRIYSLIQLPLDDKVLAEHCKVVVDQWQKASYLNHCEKYVGVVRSDKIETNDLVQSLKDLVVEIEEADPAKDYKSPKELMAEILEDAAYVEEHGEGKGVVNTGVKDLDSHTNGLMPGEVMVIAARPGIGKTEFAMKVSFTNLEVGKKVLFISFEMDEKSLFSRAIRYKYNLSGSNLRTGRLTTSAKDTLRNDNSAVNWGFYPIQVSGMNDQELRSLVRKYVVKYEIDLIVIDYLQLIEDRRGADGERAIALKSQSIKTMATENKVPCILLAQLSRATDKEKFHQPKMDHLKGSGAIEADADMVYLLWRPEHVGHDRITWDGQERDVTNQMWMLNPKFRGGNTKTIITGWYEGMVISPEEAKRLTEPF